MTSGIIEILTENVGVQALVGENNREDKYKIFPVVAPQKTEPNYITVFKGSNNATLSLSKDLPSMLDYPLVTVNCWSKVFRQTELMFEAVRAALDSQGFTTDAGYVFNRVWLVDDRDGFDNEQSLYVHVAVFAVEEKK
jgi:hypothetical protein